eukprot:96118-Chlamydomonas_euryale.AAC.2
MRTFLQHSLYGCGAVGAAQSPFIVHGHVPSDSVPDHNLVPTVCLLHASTPCACTLHRGATGGHPPPLWGGAQAHLPLGLLPVQDRHTEEASIGPARSATQGHFHRARPQCRLTADAFRSCKVSAAATSTVQLVGGAMTHACGHLAASCRPWTPVS